MTTIANRIIRSSPMRDAMQTWSVIVDLLTQGDDGSARTELLSISGIASSIIADRSPEGAAITITCDGPRTRFYCLYDDDALCEDNAKEEPLGYDPINGDWAVSLPCVQEDLSWVQAALSKITTRITARDMSQTLGEATCSEVNAQEFSVNTKIFLET